MTTTAPALTAPMLAALHDLTAARPNTLAALRRRGLVEPGELALTDAGRALVAPAVEDDEPCAHTPRRGGVVRAASSVAGVTVEWAQCSRCHAPIRRVAHSDHPRAVNGLPWVSATAHARNLAALGDVEGPAAPCQHPDGDVVDGAAAWLDAPTVEVQGGYCPCGTYVVRFRFPYLDGRTDGWEPRVSAWAPMRQDLDTVHGPDVPPALPIADATDAELLPAVDLGIAAGTLIVVDDAFLAQLAVDITADAYGHHDAAIYGGDPAPCDA